MVARRMEMRGFKRLKLFTHMPENGTIIMRYYLYTTVKNPLYQINISNSLSLSEIHLHLTHSLL